MFALFSTSNNIFFVSELGHAECKKRRGARTCDHKFSRWIKSGCCCQNFQKNGKYLRMKTRSFLTCEGGGYSSMCPGKE